MSQPQIKPRFRPPRLSQRITGLRSPGPRSIRTPSPALRSPSPALGPSSVSAIVRSQQKAPPECKSCGAIGQFEDVENGQTVCVACGTVQHDTGNYSSDMLFAETESGRTQQIGTRIGENQTHQKSYRSAGGQFGHIGHDTINTSDRAKSEAQYTFKKLSLILDIKQQEQNKALSIFSFAYSAGFVRGRTIESVATVSLYLATRYARKRLAKNEQPYSLMLIDFAEHAHMNVFDLGRMMQDMVKKLYLTVGDEDRTSEASLLLQAPGAEALVDKFVDRLDFPQEDQQKIKDDATKILQRMKRDWLHHGRRPSGVCGAAVILAARMNNYRRTLREVVLCAKVTEYTISKRLEEFQETASSKLSVTDFRTDDVREAQDEMDPPAFYQPLRPKKKKKQGRPRKSSAKEPETAAEIEGNQSDEGSDADEDVSEDENPPQKRARIDADGFAVPALPSRSALPPTPPATQPEVRRGRGKPKGSKNWKAPPPTEEELAYEAEMQNEIQEALDENQDLDIVGSGVVSGSQSNESIPADVVTTQNEVPSHTNSQGLTGRSNVGNSGNVSLEPELGDTEFNDDPEVANCLLNEAERALKEKIWVTENAEWLRQDHAKRIRRELKDQHLREQGIDPDEQRRLKGKHNLKRKDGARRSGRVGDVGYLNDEHHRKKRGLPPVDNNNDKQDEDVEAGTGMAAIERRASDSVAAMLQQRGTYSRRLNYVNLLNAYRRPGEELSTSPSPSPSPGPESSRDRDAREDSVTSSTGARSRGTGDWFRGNRYPGVRQRPRKEQGNRTRDSASASRSLSAPADEEVESRARSGSAVSPDPDAAQTPQRPMTRAPVDNDTPQHEEGGEDEEIISDTDSPLSSTHTPQGLGSTVGTPTAATTVTAPIGKRPSNLSGGLHVNEDDIESDEDDYVEDDDDGDDEDGGNEDDGVDAALAGQYNGVEWDDELVEDE